MAFSRGGTSGVFSPENHSIRIPITLHTAQKKADTLAFLDSGATENFISQKFIDEHKLGVRLMDCPRKLQNADGSSNTGGGLTHFTEREVLMGDKAHLLPYSVANIGDDDLVLGYPWFAATAAHPDWATGMLPVSVTIRTKGVASGKPMRSVRVG